MEKPFSIVGDLFNSLIYFSKLIFEIINERKSSHFNYELFSKAEEYKIMIRELMIIDNI